jgi:enamine deaminase RidA (YjgF/YER057c/UK114 family)
MLSRITQRQLEYFVASGEAGSISAAAERIHVSSPSISAAITHMEAEQAMKNVKQLLEEAGSDLSHIVKTTTYLIDPRYREPVYQEVGKWLKGVFPISTGLVISGLGQPEWLMEIDVIAVVPDDWQP